MNIAGKKRGLIGRSRDTLHKAEGITLIESTKIRWFEMIRRGKASSCYRRPRFSKLLKEGHPARVHTDQMVLMMARPEAGPVSQWPLKGYILSS
jgi:hypothetical protein